MIRLDNLIRHIAHVREACELLGRRLILAGEEGVGLALVANGQVHDASKFRGIEWQCLNDGCASEGPDELFKLALHQHVTTNRHHPEAWPGGIADMDRVHLAEMVADWKARSSEQGTDLLAWVKEVASAKFGFSLRGRVYRNVKGLVGMLLEKRFR